MVEKTRAMQMKERSFASKHFYLRNDIKGDLKGFQENFKTFFQVLPAVGQMGRILTTLRTSQIAGFVEYCPLMN